MSVMRACMYIALLHSAFMHVMRDYTLIMCACKRIYFVHVNIDMHEFVHCKS